MITDDELAEMDRRIQGTGSANCWTGTSGTIAAIARKLVNYIREGRLVEGTTSKFGTGAVRSDTAEAFRFDLISPIGLREVARTCAEGAAKYDDYNWEKGMPVHDLLNHAINHIYQFLSGDRSEPHLPHAAWNLLAAIHSEALWPGLNEGTLRGPGCSPPPANQKPFTDLVYRMTAAGATAEQIREELLRGTATAAATPAGS